MKDKTLLTEFKLGLFLPNNCYFVSACLFATARVNLRGDCNPGIGKIVEYWHNITGWLLSWRSSSSWACIMQAGANSVRKFQNCTVFSQLVKLLSMQSCSLLFRMPVVFVQKDELKSWHSSKRFHANWEAHSRSSKILFAVQHQVVKYVFNKSYSKQYR